MNVKIKIFVDGVTILTELNTRLRASLFDSLDFNFCKCKLRVKCGELYHRYSTFIFF